MSGENGKEGTKLFLRAIFKHDSTFFENEINRTNRFLTALDPEAHLWDGKPKWKCGLAGPRGTPLRPPLPDLRDSPLRGLAVPRPGPARRFSSRRRSGGLGTGPCFSP